jgi:hypothetical protein
MISEHADLYERGKLCLVYELRERGRVWTWQIMFSLSMSLEHADVYERGKLCLVYELWAPRRVWTW